MKYKLIAITLAFLILSACNTTIKNNSAQPEESKSTFINKKTAGSYASKKLITDTMLKIKETISKKDSCSKLDRTLPFILKHPTIKNGLKAWDENWITLACGKKYDFIILFKQTPNGSINFTVLLKK